MQEISEQNLEVIHTADINSVRKSARTTATAIGFNLGESEELVLVVSELASNLVRHANGGIIRLIPIANSRVSGIQIESVDKGPGIKDVDKSLIDGFSTTTSLGYGLGTVNRLMHEMDIQSPAEGGTHIITRRWIQNKKYHSKNCPLEFGVATRPHPKMLGVNGDAFILKQWDESALIGVIDGLGHGQWAHRASQTARKYIEGHFDQPMLEIFHGVGRACRATRGVVMGLARFDWAINKLTFASVGNIEIHVFNRPEPIKYIVRRGIIGLNSPNPVITEQSWEPQNIMVLHSDGIKARWNWSNYPELTHKPATIIAQRLLVSLAREDDDATVVIVRDKI